MGPLLSWMIFLAISGAVYYFYTYKKPTKSRTSRRTEEVTVSTKGRGVYLGSAGAGSGADAVPEKKKKKAQQKKPGKSQAAPKVLLSSDGSDNDVAQEEDPRESARLLQALKSNQVSSKTESTGSKPTSSSARSRLVAGKKANLAPSSPLATASQASSTGADADIDEEGSTPLNSPEVKPVSGADPSDMLEESEGPRVLTITPSTKVPRPQKEKKEPSPQPGAQHKKNQKKKDKAKLAREEELAHLKAAREQHRASQKAEETPKQQSQPSPAPLPSDSAWTTVNGKKNKSATATSEPATSTVVGTGSDLLDTFEDQHAQSSENDQPKKRSASSTPRNADSEEEAPKTHPSSLDASQWEEIPAYVREEGEWKEVPIKKSKDRSKPKPAPSESEKEEENKSKAVSSKPVATGAGSAYISTIKSFPLAKSKSSNGFEALSDDNAGRSSDWAEVGSWEVHPQ